MSDLPDPQPWDNDGGHYAGMKRLIRAFHRGTGCHLTAEMVRGLDFAEGDGEWYHNLKEALLPRAALKVQSTREQERE